MTRKARVALLALAALLVIVGVASGVVTNYATLDVPTWLRDPWRVWSLLAVLMLLAMVATLIVARTSDQQGTPAPAPLQPVVPSTLRPPHVEPDALRGRGGELTQLKRLCRAQAGRGRGSRRGQMVVVAGPGGIGKTQLVATVAAQVASVGGRVFWVRWRDEGGAEDLAVRMVEVATSLGLGYEQLGSAQATGASVIDLVWAQLERSPGWTLVLDNLDQPAALGVDGARAADYRGWLRPSVAGLVVITSRDQSPATWGSAAEVIRLSALDGDAGAEVLLGDAPHAGDHGQARALSVRLGGLPLALRAAGAALSEPTRPIRSFADYVHALATGSYTVLPERPDSTNYDTARALVGHTWELSLDQLAAEGHQLARPTLRLLALLGDAPIPRALVNAKLLADATGAEVSVARVDAALAGLRRYGLVEVLDPALTHEITTLTLHPLVRETSLQLLEQQADAQRSRDAVDAQLIAQVAETVAAARSGWDTARLLAPHLPQLGGLSSDNLDAFHAARQAVGALASQLGSAGEYRIEIPLRRKLLHAATRLLGHEHPDALQSRNNYANAYYGAGEYRRATELHQETLDVQLRVLGEENPEALGTRSNLAAALASAGEYRRAAELYQEILDVRLRVFGEEHPDTLASRSNLAAALADAGQCRRAVELGRHTVDIMTRVLGAEHPDTLASRNNLAVVLANEGEHRQAAELHQQTLDVRVRVLGELHPVTLNSRNNLAVALHAAKEHQRAAELVQQTLDALKRVLGEEHPHTLRAQNNLAIALHTAGEYRRAAELHQRTLDVRVRVLGDEHPYTHVSRDNLAAARTALDRSRSSHSPRFSRWPRRTLPGRSPKRRR